MARHRAPGTPFRTLWEEEDSRASRGLPTGDTRGKHASGPARIPYYRQGLSARIDAERPFYDGTPAGMPL